MKHWNIPIASLVFGLVLPFATDGVATPVQAEAECQTLGDGQEYKILHAAPLATHIPEETTQYPEGQRQEPETFLITTYPILLSEGERLLLSGSQDGEGFYADDMIQLESLPLGHTMEWDFRSADGMSIIPFDEPQDITHLFRLGLNEIHIRALDVTGPKYSSSALWALLMEPCGTPTPVPTLENNTVILSSEGAAITPTATVAEGIVESTGDQRDEEAVDATTNTDFVPDVAPNFMKDTATNGVAETQAAGQTDPQPQNEIGLRQMEPGWPSLWVGMPVILMLFGSVLFQRTSTKERVQGLLNNGRDNVKDWLESLKE